MSAPAASIDTSALLAFLNQEAGWEQAETWLDRGVVASALIVQELTSKLVQKGAGRADAAATVSELGLVIADLTLPLAFDAGAMIAVTQPKGLSHGDRACLALARSLSVPAVTADRPWADVSDDLGVSVELIR